MEDQPKRPSEVLAEQVKVWRDRRRLSAQGLADRIRDLGGSLSRVAISKIENGDRGVSLDEWLQLAHALAVPPVLLFVDLRSGNPVAVAPQVVLHPWLVWEWATGEQPPLVTAAKGGALVSRVEEFNSAQSALNLYRREASLGRALSDAQRGAKAAEFAGDERTAMGARGVYVEALRLHAEVLDQMIEQGIEPPGKPYEWVEDMKRLGLSRYPDRLVAVGDGDVHGER